MQTVWRYADAGWLITDESKLELDVEGLSWAPYSLVHAELYPRFEIRLAHSSRLPDEFIDATGIVVHPLSGLLDAPNPFSANVLDAAHGGQVTVHDRALGYAVDPIQSYHAPSGTLLEPFPLNRSGGPYRTYTWRDTSILTRGGADGGGIPLGSEVALGLYPSTPAGSIAPPGQVPTIGLPLLLELRCYPSSSGLGTNLFAVDVLPSSPLVNFRVHSTGGFDTAQRPVQVDPDSALVPSGGFNPRSSPPGTRTPSANSYLYFGALDTVVRVSRAHTIWLDAGSASPDYAAALVEPEAGDLPAGTSIGLDFRGATAFNGTGGDPFDAATLDPYGDVRNGTVSFLRGTPDWSSNLDAADGARFLQVRLTFVNDLVGGHSAELDSLAIAFRR